MNDTAYEADELLKLLTDALRAGPGSPSWHEAVTRLRSAGAGKDLDEYRLLLTARERLEQGKQYRSVRAGPGFTRELMESIDAEAARGRRGISPARWIAIVASIAIGVAIIAIIINVMPKMTTPPRAPVDLSAAAIARPIASVDLTARPADAVARVIGAMPLAFDRGLAPTGRDIAPGTAGGILLEQPLPADRPVAVEATLRIRRPNPQLIAQLFITDDPTLSSANAVTLDELALALQGTTARAMRNGRIEDGQSDLPDSAQTVIARLAIRDEQAIVEIDGKPIWRGSIRLKPDRPWFAGVRFLQAEPGESTGVSFEQIRVMGE
jgi:hypothetical protein